MDLKTKIWSLARKGEIRRERGEYREAEALYGQALGLAEESLQNGDLELAELFNNAAVLYKYTGRFNDARRLYWRALRIVKAAGDHRLLAGLYHNIGGLEHARGRFRRGEVFARRSVAERMSRRCSSPSACTNEADRCSSQCPVVSKHNSRYR